MPQIDINQLVPPGQTRENDQHPTTTNHSQDQPISDTSTVTKNYSRGEVPPHYFISVDPIISLIVVIGLYLITMGWLAPDYISSNTGRHYRNNR